MSPTQLSGVTLIAVAGLGVVSLYAMFLWFKLHLTFQIMRELRYNSNVQQISEPQSDQGCTTPFILMLVASAAVVFLYLSLH